MHWPFWQAAPSGQQMEAASLGWVQSWDVLQQVPSESTLVPSGQQTRVLLPGMTWGVQGQHMRRFWGGEVLTTSAQAPLQHTMGGAAAGALYGMQLLACARAAVDVAMA
jgi:hypothetical protein